MKTSLRMTSSLVLLLASLLVPLPVSAQEDESGEDDAGWGQLIAEYGTWVSEAGGLGDNVASIIDPINPFNTVVAGFPKGTSSEDYSRIGAELTGNRGRLMLTWYAHDDQNRFSGRDPGNFIYGQLLAFPSFAGLSNDGLADAFDAQRTTALRDLKIEYSRVAFSNSRVQGRWSIGFRKVKHRTRTDATYFALVPDFPAFVPPLVNALPDLTPLPETAEVFSSYEGTGLTGGMEFEAPIWRDKFSLEGSVGLSVLLGTSDTTYNATNHYYSLLGVVLDPPYTELGDYMLDSTGTFLIGTAVSVEQETLEVGLRSESLSRGAQVYEVSMGGRVRPLKYMDVFFGYRVHHYGGVGVELRPRNAVVSGNTINTTDASEVERSATYRGFYGGVGFHF